VRNGNRILFEYPGCPEQFSPAPIARYRQQAKSFDGISDGIVELLAWNISVNQRVTRLGDD
jgi:hypothetical protein